MDKINLFGMTRSDIQLLIEKWNAGKYVAGQICLWIYQKQIYDFDQMSNLSKQLRSVLKEQCIVKIDSPLKVSVSADGTKKYLFEPENNRFVETAMIPDDDRATLCLSSQSGCKMGCLFCMTAKQGFQGHLTSAQILSQIVSIPEFKQLTNFVFMGMGEPLDNLTQILKSLEIMTANWGFGYSASRITVSTIGLLEPLGELLEKTAVHLAFSLHSPFDDERRSLMPIQNAQPFTEILHYLENLELPKRRRISIEYICFEGINDSPVHAKQLAKILSHLNCRINLISYHPVPGLPYKGSSRKEMENFQKLLTDKGFICTIRKSRGQDIQAACGLLSTKELNRKHNTENTIEQTEY